MLQVRHISPFAFWLANPFRYPTPQRDIIYQNLLKINILYSTSRLDISKIEERSFGRLPQTQIRQACQLSPKSADNQYFIFDIAHGYLPRSKNGLSGGCPKSKTAKPVLCR